MPKLKHSDAEVLARQVPAVGVSVLVTTGVPPECSGINQVCLWSVQLTLASCAQDINARINSLPSTMISPSPSLLLRMDLETSAPFKIKLPTKDQVQTKPATV